MYKHMNQTECLLSETTVYRIKFDMFISLKTNFIRNISPQTNLI